ncbi:MAG TPA: transcription-repair coupling factor, partial [Rheinheimera sp.]|nr:transcription-repair coupling factor [Rheinheimera sp.]
MDLISALPHVKHANDQLHWGNLQGAALPLAIAQLLAQHKAPYLLLVPDTPTALRLEQELSVFFTTPDCPVLTLPDWETLPYDVFSPHQDIISQRLKTLHQLSRLEQGLVIVPVSTALLRICHRDYLEQNSFLIKKGQQADLAKMKLQLTAVGYRSVEQVMEHGEFSVRGSILDLYPMGATMPYRIDFFDNDVDGIRTFDPDNQRSLSQVDEIELLPAHEFPTDKAAIERFRLAYRERFPARNEKESIYQQVSQGVMPAG